MEHRTTSNIAARLERLPISAWHTRVRAVIGMAAFFDSFDALAIASVMPVLAPLWHLKPADIGLLISIGYIGQAIGSVLFGYLAQRIGRVPVALITVLIFSLMSCACALSSGYAVLMAFRFVQGLGLGGEVPVMHAYMNEISKAKGRARFILLPQLGFSFGIAAAAYAGRWIVPDFGWRAMFLVGVIPALITVPLRILLPESPRWLASVGRLDAAERIMLKIEASVSRNGARPLPPIAPMGPSIVQAPPRFAELFKGPYLRRTLVIWALFFCAYYVAYGLTNWMPTLYRTVYHVSLRDALTFGAITTTCSLIGSVLVTFLLDVTGRRLWFGVSLALAAIPFLILTLAHVAAPVSVLFLVSVGALLVNPVCIAIGVYAAECYPTHLRALGGGVGSSWIRIAAMIAPVVMGFLIPRAGMGAVFGTFGVVALAGGIVALTFAVETKGRTLEDLSPPEPVAA